MPKTYYYGQKGQQFGPVSIAELQELFRSGQLAATTLVWTEGMPAWKAATEVPELIPPVPTGKATAAPSTSLALKAVAAPGGHTPEPTAKKNTPSSDPGTPSPETPSRSVADRIKPLLTAAQQTASATARHMSGLFACVMAKGKIWRAEREAFQSQTALGQRMHSAGLGTEAQRQIVDQLNERIRSLKAAQSSARPVESELRAAHAALALPALESNQSPSGLESEYEAVRTARNNVAAAQEAANSARTGVRSLMAQRGLQIGVGYLCCALLFSTIVWASWGSDNDAKTRRSQQTQQGGVSQGGDAPPNSGEENAPYVPPSNSEFAEYTPPAPVGNQQTVCFNCNGSGQANCLQCFGSGKRTCFNCNGSGRTVNNMQCFQCNGSGKQNCSFCSYGKVQCPQCSGSGHR